jgi:hypothetical protein
MPTFSLHARQLPNPRSSRAGLSQLVSGLKSVLDLFAEVDRQGGEARQRYPFAD